MLPMPLQEYSLALLPSSRASLEWARRASSHAWAKHWVWQGAASSSQFEFPEVGVADKMFSATTTPSLVITSEHPLDFILFSNTKRAVKFPCQPGSCSTRQTLAPQSTT